MKLTVRALTVVALALLAAPLAAEAQQAGKVPRIGFLHSSAAPTPTAPRPSVDAFRQGLRDLGYMEGQNLLIEWRWAEEKLERLPALAAELVRLKVDLIYVVVCGAPLNAARQATNTIPIVIGACNDDLVGLGLVKSLARPGGNITGVSKLTPELSAKRLDLLKQVAPNVSRVAVLWNPAYSDWSGDWRELRAAARALGVTVQSVEFRGPGEFEGAFTTMTREGAEAVIAFSDSVIYSFPQRVADLAARHRIPAMYAYREITEAGGLMSYGPSLPDLYFRSATYVAKILKGAKPADLPVEQPTKFELVINLKTARALGLTIPPSVLMRADKVIE